MKIIGTKSVSSNTASLLNVSVVLATYEGESSNNLSQSIDSIISQTLKPQELIIIGDGPLPSSQKTIINAAIAKALFPVRFISLNENVGRGRARNIGIEASTTDFIALMDSDDISHPERLEIQTSFLRKNPDIDLVATLSTEFEDVSQCIDIGVIKSCPEFHAGIQKALLFSNCVTNPTIVFRKSSWAIVGGFPDFREFNEDYLFYFRMISSGAKFACIQTPLLKVRISSVQRSRRRGVRLLAMDFRFRLTSYREGHVSLFWFLAPLFFVAIRRLLPAGLGRISQKIWRNLAIYLHR